MNNPCQNCTAGEWGFCYHQEYGPCIHADKKSNDMEKTYSMKDLMNMDFFQLIEVAEKLKIENYEHFNNYELIRAIRDKQHELATAEKEAIS